MSKAKRRWLVGLLLAVVAGPGCGAGAQTPEQLDALAAAGRWAQMAEMLAPLAQRTADQDFAYARALAHLDRLPEAERALEDGERLAPHDARFPVELAGIAFKKKRYPEAAARLRLALKFAPGDAYANDFLATVYFLEGNLPAAVKYWNRAGKPRVHEVRLEPTPRVDAALLDHAFAFAPATTLTLPQLEDSAARVEGMGIFTRPQMDLRARMDGDFDLVFRGNERNGFGDSRLEAAVTLLHQLPFQAVTADYFNARRQAINVTSLIRWDAQKRRIRAEVAGPLDARARWRYDVGLDMRNENWAVRNGFTGTAPVLASLNLRREAGSIEVVSNARDRLRWRLGGEVSNRDHRSVEAGAVLTPELLATGIALKQTAQAESTLLRVPERRFTLTGGGSSQAARLWAAPGATFEKLQGGLFAQWFPRVEGDDYEVQDHVRAGKTWGAAPFDELFMLGLERDNDLPLRAHIGTRDGRKGAAPLGRNYFANTWELDKTLYSNGLMAVKLGPFVDAGAISDANPALGSHKWLVDTGAQVKLRVFATTVAFSYGKDLRSGNNAFYISLLP